MHSPVYPVTRTVDQIDDYHGVKVADPYRWLEDETSPDRAEWIAAQNAATAAYLAQADVHNELRGRFQELLDYPRYYDLSRRGPFILFSGNTGLRNQLALYIQRGLDGEPEVLVDPTDATPDGTTRVTAAALSADAHYVAYGLSYRGSDWNEYRVRDVRTKQDLPERLQWVKATGIAWHHDGFYYSRYPAPDDENRTLSARNENHQVWYHRVGTPQSADQLLYEDREHPLRFHFVQTTEDERFVARLSVDAGGDEGGNALWLLDSRATWQPVVTAFTDDFRLIDSDGDELIVLTNRRAPRWRVVRIDPANPDETNWVQVIGETRDPIEVVSAIGEKLFVCYRCDAATRLCVYDRTGALEDEIGLPGLGLARVFEGQQQDAEALWSFTSFTTPTTIYRYDIATRTSCPWRKPPLQFDPDDYATTRVFYPSRDGTQIPMFLIHRKGIEQNGTHRLLLSGYGGSNSAVDPSFDPLLIALLERGVIYAVPGLRGGGEYGEEWHRAGWRDKKQNVFDDCIAALEWLQANQFTTCDRCALSGSSNGGLLVGAVMVQRPDLLGVALPTAGPMDMLRLQHFTIGWVGSGEYGSSDDPAMFPILFAYSPLHNIERGVRYPATLVMTSQHDDRVVPAHSFKFISTLQARGAPPGPYLIRIDSNSGHGAVSLPKLLDERADQYAFLLTNTGGPSADSRQP